MAVIVAQKWKEEGRFWSKTGWARIHNCPGQLHDVGKMCSSSVKMETSVLWGLGG